MRVSLTTPVFYRGRSLHAHQLVQVRALRQADRVELCGGRLPRDQPAESQVGDVPQRFSRAPLELAMLPSTCSSAPQLMYGIPPM